MDEFAVQWIWEPKSYVKILCACMHTFFNTAHKTPFMYSTTQNPDHLCLKLGTTLKTNYIAHK